MDRTSPQSSSDQQCPHCGKWFNLRGIDSHRRNCSLKGYDATLVPLEDSPSPDVDAGDVDGTDHCADPTPTTATDGGEALEPPTPDVKDDAGEDDPSGDRRPRGNQNDQCPSCGSEDWFDVDALPDRILQERPKLRQYDRACADCSITSDGRLSSNLEVYAS
jgi:hypothetical protein